MRKTHTKSRGGCKQCKERKVKCDEKKPACTRCFGAERECTYLVSGPSAATPSGLVTPAPSIQSSSGDSERPSRTLPFFRHLPDAFPVTDSVFRDAAEALREPGLTIERYSLLHLELIHHLHTEFSQITAQLQPRIGSILTLAYKEALRAPYVMDEILALTAAHKSTVVDADRREIYLVESTKLQTRALAQVHPQSAVVTDDNVYSLFCFSVFLGQHALFEVFSDVSVSKHSSLDLSLVLDRLSQCLYLHSGIGAIAGSSQSKLREQSTIGEDEDTLNNYYKPTKDLPDVAGMPDKECAPLAQRLEASPVDEATKAVYRTALKTLQHLHDAVCDMDARRATALHQWLVRVPNEYNLFLRQRRPEALVVLAHFGVLLHFAKDYWAVGDSGRLLIRAISSHLGEYWADWLAWPRKVLATT